MSGMQLPQTRAGDVSIYLRRGKVTVSEQHLDGTQVRTVVEQVGGKRMPEAMG
jgi:hypothetical protein